MENKQAEDTHDATPTSIHVQKKLPSIHRVLELLVSSQVLLLLAFSSHQHTTLPPPDWHLKPLCFHTAIKPTEEINGSGQV